MMEKFCLQCGAELKMISVPLNPNNAGSLSVAACSACGSQKYDTPNGVGVDRMKSQEALTKAGLSCEDCEGYVFRGIEILTAQRDELLTALRALYGWTKAEVEHFGATCPDDFIIERVEKALKNA